MTPAGPTEPPVAGARPRLDGLPLHPRLEAVLRRLQAAERAAVGRDRRPTFKLTRDVLGASVRLGVPVPLLAACLGTSRASLRDRASFADGTITAELVRQLTDLTPRQLDRLSMGELSRDGTAADRDVYPAVDVVRALLKTPWPKATRPRGAPTRAGSRQPANDPGAHAERTASR